MALHLLAVTGIWTSKAAAGQLTSKILRTSTKYGPVKVKSEKSGNWKIEKIRKKRKIGKLERPENQ